MTLVFQQPVAASTEESGTLRNRQAPAWAGPEQTKNQQRTTMTPSEIPTPPNASDKPCTLESYNSALQSTSDSQSSTSPSQAGPVKMPWEDRSWKDLDLCGRICMCICMCLIGIFFAILFISFYGSIMYGLWHLFSWLFAWYTSNLAWCPAAPSPPAQAQLVRSAVSNSFRFNVVWEGRNVTMECPNYLANGSGGSYLTCRKL